MTLALCHSEVVLSHRVREANRCESLVPSKGNGERVKWSKKSVKNNLLKVWKRKTCKNAHLSLIISNYFSILT